MNTVNPVDWSNTTKANVIAFVNALGTLALAFGVDVTAEQLAAIATIVNMLFALFVSMTYKRSPMRISE